MDFPHDAACYVLYEAHGGSNVGSATTWAGLRVLLDEIVSERRGRLSLVAVVALDDKGQRIGTLPAESVLETA
ncbi:MAG: hypothetical protein WD965_02455 [Actinomycetota bacterium]